MRVYISGPITGVENYERIFLERELHLRQSGYDVINPASAGARLRKDRREAPTWEDYMRLTLRLLLSCDAISMLPGHKESKGATLELQIARALKLKEIKVYETGA